MSLLNPMGLTGPNATTPYQQPGTAAPSANPLVASYPVGANVMNLTWPIPVYTQPNIAGPTPRPAFPLSSGVD